MSMRDTFTTTIAATTGGVLSSTIKLGGLGPLLNLEIDNDDATDAVTAFEVQLQDHPLGAWYTYLSGTDWQSTSISNMLFATTTSTYRPNDVGATKQAHAHIRINAAYAIRFKVTTAGNASIVIRGTFYNE